MAADAGFLSAPIPGMSLTTEPGNRPWEQPPMLVTVEDALEFYVKKILTSPENHDNVLNMVEAQVPVANIAAILQKLSVMNGYHTIDVGILVTPAIEEMIMAVADMHGVRYARDVNEILESKLANPRAVSYAMRELKAAMEAGEQPPAVTEEQAPAPEPQAPAGLMARPQMAASPEMSMGMGE